MLSSPYESASFHPKGYVPVRGIDPYQVLQNLEEVLQRDSVEPFDWEKTPDMLFNGANAHQPWEREFVRLSRLALGKLDNDAAQPWRFRPLSQFRERLHEIFLHEKKVA